LDSVHPALAVGELLQPAQLDVGVRGLAAERRAGDSHDFEAPTGDLRRVADLDVVLSGVAEVDDRLAPRLGRSAREVAALGDLSRGDGSDGGPSDVHAGHGLGDDLGLTTVHRQGAGGALHRHRALERDGSQGKACGGVLDTVEALDPGHLGGREAELGRENAVDRVLLARIAEFGEVEIEGVVPVLLLEGVLLGRPELAEGPGARAAIVGDGDRTADGEVGADSG
jgi:hypothetical protein